MNDQLAEIVRSSARRALVARERDDEAGRLCSHGAVPLGRVDEDWPTKGDRPLFPILTIGIVELPFVPEFLAGAAYWAFFIEPDEYSHATDDGSLVVRRYKSVDGLQPLTEPADVAHDGPELVFEEVVDYPCRSALRAHIAEDAAVSASLDPESVREIPEEFRCHGGIKLAGYPALVQETVFLQTLDPDHAIQLDATDVYMYADTGIGYLPRNLDYAHWECM